MHEPTHEQAAAAATAVPATIATQVLGGFGKGGRVEGAA